VLEFWPEYHSGPLWSDGKSIDLDELPISDEFRRRLREWNARYDDSKLFAERQDENWVLEGRRLLAELRAALGTSAEVVVTEPWWGEEPAK
jgi:hypothetical protein